MNGYRRRSTAFRRKALSWLSGCLGILIGASGLYGEENARPLEVLKSDIEQLKNWLDAAKNQQSQLERQLEDNEKQLSILSRQVQQIKVQLKEEEQRLKKLLSQRTSLQSQLLAHEQALSQQLAWQYRWPDQNLLKAVLGASQPQAIARRVKYVSHLHAVRVETIKEYRHNLAEVQTVQQKVLLSQENKKLEANKLAVSLGQLRSVAKNRSEVLAKLKMTIANKDDQLKSQEEQRQRLEALLAKVEHVLDRYPKRDQLLAFGDRQGALPVPVAGTLVQGYAQGSDLTNRGWLIRAEEGTAVMAVHHGRVVFADWLRGYGLMVIVDHGQGYMTLYARNQSLLKSEGEWVSAGDALATLGRSGGYHRSALYFEIRHQGQPVNPKLWLAKG